MIAPCFNKEDRASSPRTSLISVNQHNLNSGFARWWCQTNGKCSLLSSLDGVLGPTEFNLIASAAERAIQKAAAKRASVVRALQQAPTTRSQPTPPHLHAYVEHEERQGNLQMRQSDFLERTGKTENESTDPRIGREKSHYPLSRCWLSTSARLCARLP